MNWTIAATFDNAVAAELAKSMLASHGVPVMLSDELTVATAWNLSNSVGGIKLSVPVEALGRAEYLLEHKSAPPRTDEEIAEAVAARPEIAEGLTGPGPVEPFDDTPTDIELDKVLKATVFGLLFPPVQLYTLGRLWMLRYADPPVRHDQRWKVWLAYALSLPLWVIVLVPMVLFLGRFDPGPSGAWRNARFTGVGDVALTVDLPGEYAFELHDAQTALGPAKVRSFGVNVGNEDYFVQIFSLENRVAPENPQAAVKSFVDRQFAAPGYRIESREAGTLGGFPSVDAVVEFVDRLTDKARVIRQRAVIVGPHIVTLMADLPADQRDSRIAERFFRTAQIE